MGVEHLDLPAAVLRVAGVHSEQVGCEQGRFLAALAGLNLDDRVAEVVGVTRGQQPGQPFGGFAHLLLQRLHLGDKRRVLRGQFLGRGQVVVESPVLGQGLDDGRQLRIAPPQPTGKSHVGMGGRIGQLPFNLGVLSDQGVGSLRHHPSCGLVTTTQHRSRITPAPVPTDYFFLLAFGSRLAYLRSNRATRPPVSRIFCRPV